MNLIAPYASSGKNRIRLTQTLRMMKLTALLMIVGCLSAGAKGFTQNVTLYEQNASLDKVLNEIKKQTGYSFLFTESQLGLAKKVTIKVYDVELEKALQLCFADQPFSYTIIEKTIVVKPKKVTASILESPPLQKDITGRVTDADGKPLAGASINVKGTSIGTTTDANGEFNLRGISKDAVLIISYIGYESQHITITNLSELKISLKKGETELVQAVVVGYGSQRKRDLTGAVAVIDSKVLEDRPNTQFGNSIEGKAAGVQVVRPSGQPDAGFSVIVRGVSSITSGSDPVYIVDGVQTFNTSEINPADIESISILKDASSAAIYGSSGANGVVLITTKHGKKGKSKVIFGTSLTSSEPWKKLPILNAAQYESLMNEMGISINWANYTANTNWQNLVFRDAQTQNYNLSISGGDERTQYYLSGSLVDQQGIVINSSVNRATFNLNLDHKVSDFFKVGANLSYDKWNDVHILENSRNGVIARLLTTTPVIGVWDPTYPTHYATSPVAPVDVENPVAAAYQPQNLFVNNRLHGHAYAELSILPDLKFKSMLGLEHWNSIATSYQNTFQTIYGRAQNGIATETDKNYDYWVSENTLNYNKKINDHSLTVLAGFIASRINSREVDLSASGFGGSDAVQTVTAGTIQAVPYVNIIQESKASFIGRLTYSYKDKYLFTSNFRRDGSGQFPEQSRWQSFPSFSLGWRVSQEDFMKSVGWIDDLKIRGGWGQVGNDNANPYAWYGQVAANSSYAIGTSPTNGFSPSTQENPNLKWEVTDQSNIGFDLTMLNHRITVTSDYYDKKTNGLLLQVPIPASVGIPGNIALENAGSIQNKGFEFQLITKNIVKKDFSWSSDFNIYLNRGKVLSIVGTTMYTGQISPADNYDVAIVQAGLPLGSFYGKYSLGVDKQTGMIDYLQQKNGGGDSLGVIGNANPKYSYGFTNSFRYKSFSLDIFLQGVQGNQIFNGTRILSEAMTNGENQSAAVLKRWEKTGDVTSIPKSTLSDVSNVYPSTRFIENGSYLRVKSVTLSYSLPQSIVNKIKANKCMLYLTAENLFTFTKYSGFDPEVSAFNATSINANSSNNSNTNRNTAPGVDFGTYPQSRDIIVGLNLTF